MIIRRLPALVVLPVLLASCSGSSAKATPDVPIASAPAPGVTLPPGPRRILVPAPDDVPAGFIVVYQGSGPRNLATVAGYSGKGALEKAAAAKLTAHGFVTAYVGQYVNVGTGAVISVVASAFATASGAAADFADDQKAPSGTTVTAEQVGEASSATVQDVTGAKVKTQLLLLRFRKGVYTWSLAYQAAPTADVAVAVDLAKKVLARA